VPLFLDWEEVLRRDSRCQGFFGAGRISGLYFFVFLLRYYATLQAKEEVL